MAWQPTPVFLPGESYGQRSLADYEPWGHKESDMTEVTEYARTQWHKVIMLSLPKGVFYSVMNALLSFIYYFEVSLFSMT